MTELREKLNEIIEEKNLKILPENLRVGAEAFGINGTFTSDATATASDIAKDKTAYINGEKIVGTMSVSEYNALISTEGLTSKDSTFAHKLILKELDFTDLDISMFTTFAQAFDGCKLLTKIKGLKISKNVAMNTMFRECSNLTEISDCILKTCTNTGSMFYGCSKIQEIGDWLDTSQSTYMNQMFFGCTSLVTIPPLNASKLSTSEKAIANMFYNCPKLSDESLNNIMGMCITATSVASGYRTLRYTGLTEEQATRCQGLSNYQAFLDAGWQTGF